MLSTDDRLTIAETLALHAYIADGNQLDRLHELFTPDAVYDMSATGLGVFEGLDTIRAAAAQMAASGHGPRAHFVTNIVVTGGEDDTAAVQSLGLMIMADGSVQAVAHADTLRHHDAGWRISRRVISPIPAPAAKARLADGGAR